MAAQEPVNGHVIAVKTGLTWPVFGVSNACNSVLNALEVADAFIRAGRYRRVLIACGEALGRLSQWTLPDPAALRTACSVMPNRHISRSGSALSAASLENPQLVGEGTKLLVIGLL
ncbi:hypothetical protein [Streptomyces sp. A30]|uniref:hypothetical protein n=1 Tax=Streptomyces sp. A30 TaxID=2789273 RepID=UPI00397F4E10